MRKLKLIFLIAIIPSLGFSQHIPDSLVIKIDSLFAKWATSNSPGAAIGVIRNDSLIFSKGYGMANLEYDIPNSPKTIFQAASVSKQFTGYAIVLLAKQGKIQFDDDIRKYLPWFPDLKQKITILNLLNHTSGIRELWQLLGIAGTREDDIITHDHIKKLLSKQQALNFKPGEIYAYSNSNYFLLSEIIKATTGQPLRQYADSAIFKPLGMNNTFILDDYREVVKNRANSYHPKDDTTFSNAIVHYSYTGSANVYTNVLDMSKWIMNFYAHKVGDQTDINLFTHNGQLNNGSPLHYACGIVSDTYLGWRRFEHDGGTAGYKTYVAIFPDLKMGFILLGNSGNISSREKTLQIVDLFIKDKNKKTNQTKPTQENNLELFTKAASLGKKYAGDYFGEDGLELSLKITDEKLYYDFPKYGDTGVLISESPSAFSIYEDSKYKFKFSISNKDTNLTIIYPALAWPGRAYYLKKYAKGFLQTDELLKTYTGQYFCPELDCSYGIILKDHQLYLTNSKYNDEKLTLATPNDLLNSFRWMNHLTIVRNKNDQIEGFEVNTTQTRHLKFIKKN